MLNFDNFFRNHFDSTQISDDELNRYSVEHIKLLAAVPRFSGLVTGTIAAHEGYFGARIGPSSAQTTFFWQ
jgi:hypothetical protein